MMQLTTQQLEVIDLCIKQLQWFKYSNDLKIPTVPIDMETEWASLAEEMEIDLEGLDRSMHSLYWHISRLHDK